MPSGADARRLRAMGGHAALARRSADTQADRARRRSLPRSRSRYPDRQLATTFAAEFPLVVDRERARFSTLVRALPALVQRHRGRARHVRRLHRAAAVRRGDGLRRRCTCRRSIPIGRVRRKGPNNTLERGPDDVGSPWAIGAREGGHKAIHPQLGTLDDFRRARRARARRTGSRSRSTSRSSARPTIPTSRQHPEWFRHRARTAPSSTRRTRRRSTRTSIRSISSPRLERAVARAARRVRLLDRRGRARSFASTIRTPSRFAFWEWVIGEIKREHPGRHLPGRGVHAPEGMHRLAKLGFSQSYTYFTWRNTQAGADRVLHRADAGAGPRLLPAELLAEHAGHPARVPAVRRPAGVHGAARARGNARRQLRHLRTGVRAAGARAARAGRGGVPGLGEVRAASTGISSARTACAPFIARLNAARRDNPALQRDGSLHFHRHRQRHAASATCELRRRATTSCWSSSTSIRTTRSRAGLTLDLGDLRPRCRARPYQVHDLLTDARYLWSGAAQLRRARSARARRRTCSSCAAACAPSATSTISCKRCASARPRHRRR